MFGFLRTCISILILKSYLTQACPIYLTIGLDGSTYQESTLHLNWASDCYIRPQWYGIYSEEPSTTLLQPFIRLYNISNATFQLSINQKIGKLKFPKGWNRNDANIQPTRYAKSKCLDYYVASFQYNELLSVECIKIYPTWLTMQPNIAKMQLKELFIPEETGKFKEIDDIALLESAWKKVSAYEWLNQNPVKEFWINVFAHKNLVNGKEPFLRNYLLFIIKFLNLPVINAENECGTHASGAYLTNYSATTSVLIREYAVSQYFDVWTQLVFGIRYLDLSIGYQPVVSYDTQNPENYWIVNENKFINQLQLILKDVREFVSISGEVVILDFSSFPIGFYNHPERHAGLLHLITNELGHLAYQRPDKMIPCYDFTIEEIISTNNTIVILYPLEELEHPENDSPILCPPWKRFSTGFMNNSQAYMRLLFSKKKSSPVQDEGWVFNAIKSMEQSLNSYNKLQTAKERASHINSKVSNWLRGRWSSTANVVALDYFSSTNIIDVAINANIQKAFSKLNKNCVKLEITEK